MLGKITQPAALAAALAFGSMPAMAAMQPQETPADLSAFQTAKMSLEQTVAAVQALTGGVVTSAGFHSTPVVGPKPPYAAAAIDGNPEGYVVTFIADGTTNICFVDPQSGNSFQVGTEGTANYDLQMTDQRDYLALERTPNALPQAITLAEQQVGGHAIYAAPERHGGTLGYRIGVVRDGTVSNEWVDPGSGQIASVE